MKPNILWICTDQQRFDTLGCYGNAFVNTPNLDNLAKGGVLFENAFSQSPVCTPSRGCFLTGRYPRTCRSRQNGADIPENEILITKILSEDGYVCGLSGKLHLSACAPNACKGTERRIDDGYDYFAWSHDSNNLWPSNEYYLWLKEKKAHLTTKNFKLSRFVKIGQKAENHQTTWCAEKAISFIENAAQFNHPWLFSVNIYDPHHNFDPPENFLLRYIDILDEIPLPNYVDGELEDKPIWQKIDHQGGYGGIEKYKFPRMKDKDHKLIKAAYWAMCDLIDEQVGRILECLKDTNQLDNTIVIFHSDHGEMLGDHGIYLKGPYFYEPAIKIPLIISWPKSIQSRKINALTELIDLPQTLLDAVGLPHHPGMQGKSFWPLLIGQKKPDFHREDIYCEYYNAMPWHKDPSAQSTMVRTDRYKLAVDHTNSFGELYDLKKDPGETHNLWNNTEFSQTKLDMLLRLSNRMAFTVDPLPPRRGNF